MRKIYLESLRDLALILLTVWMLHSLFWKEAPIVLHTGILKLEPVTVSYDHKSFGGVRIVYDVEAYDDFFDEEKVVIDYQAQTGDDVILQLGRERIVEYMYGLDFNVLNRPVERVEVMGFVYSADEWLALIEAYETN